MAQFKQRSRKISIKDTTSIDMIEDARQRILSVPRAMQMPYAARDQTLLIADGVLASIFWQLNVTLLGGGLILHDGHTFSKGSDDFKRVSDRYLLPFVGAAFRMWLENGFVVFSVDSTADNIQVPFIPDLDDVRVFCRKKSDTNRNFEVIAEWQENVLSAKGKRSSINQPLWVLSEYSTLGLGYGFSFSLLSAIQDKIILLGQSTISHIIIAHRNANPNPYYVNDGVRTGAVEHGLPSNSMTNSLSRQWEDRRQLTMRSEVLRSQLVQNAKEISDTVAPNDGMVFATASARAVSACNNRDADGVELVPSGNSVVYPPIVSSDLDYVNLRTHMVEEMRAVFGFGPDIVANASIHLEFGRVLSQIITIVYDVLYNQGNGTKKTTQKEQRMAAVRRTYQEEHAVDFEMDVDVDDFDDGGDGADAAEDDYKVYLFEYAKMNFDLAAQMKDSKFITEYEFYNRFPMQLELDRYKDQQKMQMDQLKMQRDQQKDAKEASNNQFKLDNLKMQNERIMQNAELLEQKNIAAQAPRGLHANQTAQAPRGLSANQTAQAPRGLSANQASRGVGH